jgi:hypothetical protein
MTMHLARVMGCTRFGWKSLAALVKTRMEIVLKRRSGHCPVCEDRETRD